MSESKKGVKNMIGSFGGFILLYLLFMLPTYVLPYFGSNSAILGAAAASQGWFMTPQFILHALSLFVLIFLARVRGGLIDKKWIVVFPTIATFFDLVPGINLIPLIPTLMHIGALVAGARGKVAATA